MNIGKILKLLGALDGAIAALAGIYGASEPAHMTLALAIAAIAGGIGTVLNTVSKLLGGGTVVTLPPATITPDTSKSTSKPAA
jgi:uncharacterized membrane protein HdeD (DUF308 family)